MHVLSRINCLFCCLNILNLKDFSFYSTEKGTTGILCQWNIVVAEFGETSGQIEHITLHTPRTPHTPTSHLTRVRMESCRSPVGATLTPLFGPPLAQREVDPSQRSQHTGDVSSPDHHQQNEGAVFQSSMSLLVMFPVCVFRLTLCSVFNLRLICLGSEVTNVYALYFVCCLPGSRVQLAIVVHKWTSNQFNLVPTLNAVSQCLSFCCCECLYDLVHLILSWHA